MYIYIYTYYLFLHSVQYKPSYIFLWKGHHFSRMQFNLGVIEAEDKKYMVGNLLPWILVLNIHKALTSGVYHRVSQLQTHVCLDHSGSGTAQTLMSFNRCYFFSHGIWVPCSTTKNRNIHEVVALNSTC